MKKRDIYFLLLLITLFSCGSSNNNKEEAIESTKKQFILPQIPAILNTQEQKRAYLSKHFWDNFNFSDTTLISDSEFTERALAEFINILKLVKPNESDTALKSLITAASKDSSMLHHFIEITEKYLYNPNSPFRNNTMYISVLEGVISLENLEDIYKIRPKYQLELEKKNMVGERATNFNYTLANGTTSNLYSVNSKYTLLIFSNPDCMECARVKQQIMETPLFTNNKEIKILSIYPDKDLTIWKDAIDTFPKEWINGYDKGYVSENSLYDLRAIPTLYLLDRDKIVLLKDATIESVHKYLEERASK